MKKPRITYILTAFPQISQTYIRSELEAIADDYDIQILSYNPPNIPYRNHLPYQFTQNTTDIEKAIEEFQPDILHTHWLVNTRIIAYFSGYFSSQKRQIPFTIRAHSFDILGYGGKYIYESVSFINSELCLGVLTFPFTRTLLEKAAIDGNKIYDCNPVVNFRRFYDKSPNKKGVMNSGAGLSHKGMEDFLELALIAPHKQYNLYTVGYNSSHIEHLNQKMSNPVNIIAPVQPEDMLAEYKKHEWLVRTGTSKVGWPITIAEAMAAGVGTCFPNLRPDLKDYVGDAGFLYDSISEVAEIISQPFPKEMREKGFEQARKSDIFQHKYILTDLWQQAINSPASSVNIVCEPDAKVVAWGTGETPLEKRYQRQQTLLATINELQQTVPTGETVIVVGDSQQWGDDFILEGRHILPFIEQNGQYWGVPENDSHALRELERIRQSGANYIAFLQDDFWWFDYYAQFYQALRNQFSCVLKNERLAIFALC
jgi:glycosyltransferase involved in cell wall biosynthesis